MKLPGWATQDPRRWLPGTSGKEAGESAAILARDSGERAFPFKSAIWADKSRVLPSASIKPGFSEPGAPYRGNAVAGLQHGPHPLAGAPAHEAQMPAMAARQEFDDGGGFAMPPYPQHDAFVGPFHGTEFTGFLVVGAAVSPITR